MSESIQRNIIHALDSIRPYLQEDGGDVEFVGFESEYGIARVRLTGACKTCPISVMTLRAGIERILKKNVPQIRRVEAA